MLRSRGLAAALGTENSEKGHGGYIAPEIFLRDENLATDSLQSLPEIHAKIFSWCLIAAMPGMQPSFNWPAENYLQMGFSAT